MKTKGFTLFEMLVSVSLFLLMSGAIYMIVSTAIRTSATLTRHRLNSERLETLFSFLRSVFANLPPSAELSFQIREFGDNAPELHFQQAPGIFPWKGGSNSAHVISILSDTQNSTLAIKSYSANLYEEERKHILSEKSGWIHLLKGVSRIQWKFFDAATNSFREEWNFGRPQLVEMTLWQADQPDPVTAQFWIPTTQKVQAIQKRP